jgi:thiamine-phosphate pyrophosphorylase
MTILAPRQDSDRGSSRGVEIRERVRLMLLFTPELCAPRDPMEILGATLDSVDLVQVRPKPLGSGAPCSARETFDWCVRVLDLVRSRNDVEVAVIVDDRVDVAAALLDRGCAGVHLGRDDCPVETARNVLGDRAWIGLSTHDARQVAEAWESPVDYLGFGPIHATSTKGYARGLGSEAAWIASEAADVPLFPIGGIEATNIGELSRIGRAVVGSAILGASDPGRASRELRELLVR